MAGYVEPRVTRDSVLQDYMRTLDAWQKSYETPGASASSMSNFNRLSKLKELLAMGDFGEGQTDAPNPFSAGGGAPTVSTDNRFAAGLSDAESRLRALLENPDSINQSAAYKFRLGQGMEALQRSLGAKGLLNSGNRLTAMNDYAQGEASQEYGNQFNRLASLYGQNAQGYIGDKNANTAQFAAQSGAYNTAQRNNDAAQLGWGELNLNSKKPGMNPIYRSISQSGGDINGAIGGYWDPEKDPAIARMRQDRIDAYKY